MEVDVLRYKNLERWKEGTKISDFLFDIADKAEAKKFFHFTDQLRALTMSITNNIAEGSGSFTDKEFASFLNILRRSLFECVNTFYTSLNDVK